MNARQRNTVICILALNLFILACGGMGQLLESTVTQTSIPIATPTSKPTITPVPLPEIQTSFGTLVVKSAQLSEVFPIGCTSFCMEPAASGHLFLVVILDGKEGSDIGAIGLELGDQSLWPQISVTTGSGFQATVGGGGMSPDLFIEFSVPADSEGFTLQWADNPPIELEVQK